MIHDKNSPLTLKPFIHLNVSIGPPEYMKCKIFHRYSQSSLQKRCDNTSRALTHLNSLLSYCMLENCYHEIRLAEQASLLWSQSNNQLTFVFTQLQEEHVPHNRINIIQDTLKHLRWPCGVVLHNEGTELVISHCIIWFVRMCNCLLQYLCGITRCKFTTLSQCHD